MDFKSRLSWIEMLNTQIYFGQLISTAFHLQTDGQTMSMKKMIVTTWWPLSRASIVLGELSSSDEAHDQSYNVNIQKNIPFKVFYSVQWSITWCLHFSLQRSLCKGSTIILPYGQSRDSSTWDFHESLQRIRIQMVLGLNKPMKQVCEEIWVVCIHTSSNWVRMRLL